MTVQQMAESYYPEFAFIQKSFSKFGFFFPNLNSLLGTPERCQRVLLKAGYVNVEVIEESGCGHWHRPDSDVQQACAMFPEEIPAEIVDALKEDLTNQLLDRLRPEGIWSDSKSLFVFATR
mmetsp:Transcript_30326/g.49008  ORF Transcript_30326/g.49008 Transcript_30326/m.49008 type:complete len:121 (+) Transcript_30326:14-376(+)